MGLCREGNRHDPAQELGTSRRHARAVRPPGGHRHVDAPCSALASGLCAGTSYYGATPEARILPRYLCGYLLVLAETENSIRGPRREQARLPKPEYDSWAIAMVGVQAEIELRNFQMVGLRSRQEEERNARVERGFSNEL